MSVYVCIYVNLNYLKDWESGFLEGPFEHILILLGEFKGLVIHVNVKLYDSGYIMRVYQ